MKIARVNHETWQKQKYLQEYKSLITYWVDYEEVFIEGLLTLSSLLDSDISTPNTKSFPFAE